MALAPLTVQCMPARLSRVPITNLQADSTTPVEVQKPCFSNLGIPHAPSISPDVLNTFSCLFVLTDVAAQRVHQGFQVTFIELLTACVDPWLALGAIPVNDFSHFAEMFFGMKAIENLSGLREQFATCVPNPARAIAQHRLTPGFRETAAAGLACTRAAKSDRWGLVSGVAALSIAPE